MAVAWKLGSPTYSVIKEEKERKMQIDKAKVEGKKRYAQKVCT